MDLEEEITAAREHLLSVAASVAARAHDVQRKVSLGRLINPLGELQQLGPQLDAACARYATLAELAAREEE